MKNILLALALSLPSLASAQACDKTVWKHIYHKERLVVQHACVSVTGTIVDASHGRRKDGARHEADGDGHFWLKLDPGQEQFLNAKNLSNEGGNLVFEPICRYRVTQADAIAACKGYQQPLFVPAVGTHVRMTGDHVLDKQHGHMELHPVYAIAELVGALAKPPQ